MDNIKKTIKKDGRYILQTSFGSLEVIPGYEDTFTAFFRPTGRRPVVIRGVACEEIESMARILSYANEGVEKKKWDFIYDEERYTPDGRLFWAGLLTNGEDYLYWKTDPTEYSDEPTTCHIYNSILMTDDSEEVAYIWTAENDELVVNCLNNLEDPMRFSGDDSALLELEFLPFEQCSKYEDNQREVLRREISPLLNGTDIDFQMECDITVCDGKTHIDRCHQIPGEGTIWFHLSEKGDMETDEEGYVNFDDFSITDLHTILENIDL